MQLHRIGVILSGNPKLHNIPQEVSLYYSVSEKTYVIITASTISQTTLNYQKKEDQVVFDEGSTPCANSKTWYISSPQHKHVCKLVATIS